LLSDGPSVRLSAPDQVALTRSAGYPFAALGQEISAYARRESPAYVKLLAPLERAYYFIIRPIVDWLLRTGVRPNTITTIGTGVVLLSAVAYGAGWVRMGGALLLLSGLVDTLDGQVARKSGQDTKFGAFYDSTLDRVGDGATFIGIATYLLMAPDVAWRPTAIVVCMVAILASLLVSYARARAEGLGIDCKVGIAQRAERIVLLGVASVLVGAGPRAIVLNVIVGLLALASLVTVVQRFVYVYRVTQGAAAPAGRAEESPAPLDPLVKGR
jgi:CDP-diacylglycerol---glycerol-3-phosphate 3-phosphatidyltransferase